MNGKHTVENECIYIHILAHTYTSIRIQSTVKSTASTSKMILKSMWSLCTKKNTKISTSGILVRARSISSQCYCCVSTDMDDDSRGKIVNCVSTCNKVNRMEHVFASAMLLLLVLVLVLLTFNLQHLSLSLRWTHIHAQIFHLFNGSCAFQNKAFLCIIFPVLHFQPVCWCYWQFIYISKRNYNFSRRLYW